MYWCPSAYVGGSPGRQDESPTNHAIVINEVLAHSDTGGDWIELLNTTNEAINIGGWYLSDVNVDDPSLKKFEIPDNTWIGAGEYLVFYESLDFGNETNPGCHVSFALSENGESVCLTLGYDGQVGGYREQETFGATEQEVALGRYYKPSTGTYNFVAMSAHTPGQANADPKVGPIIIDRIMYNPIFGYTQEEYIRLKNISNDPVMLQEYDNDLDMYIPWKFTDGIDYTFPLGIVVPAGDYVVVEKDVASFEDRYGTAGMNVQLLGPYDGQLYNTGEKVELSKPGDQDPVTDERYYIRVDRVNYDNIAPWPTEPDGGGNALGRISDTAYGNDVSNWQSILPGFSEITYYLEISTSGNGTVQVDPSEDWFPENTKVELNAIPDQGWWLISWSGADDDATYNLSNTVTMNADRQVNVVFGQEAISTATKCTIKAGKETGQDSITIAGHFLASADYVENANDVFIQISSPSQPIYWETIPLTTFTNKNDVFKCKNTTGITSVKLNTKKRTFSLTAKHVDLGALNSPVDVEILISDYHSYIEIDETIINGSNKTIPMVLLRSYENSLYVNPKKTKVKSGSNENSDTLIVKGAIAVENYPLDVTQQEVVITWGEQTFTIPEGSFIVSGTEKYSCKKFTTQSVGGANTAGLVTVILDLYKCTFSLSVKDTSLNDKSGDILFNLQFGSFAIDPVTVSLP